MHRSRTAILSLGALVAIAFCAPASAVIVRDNRKPSTQGDVWEPDAGFVVDINVLLVKNRTVVFSTRNLSGNGDPILHLLPPGASANGPVQQVAMDDDSGGNLNARLRFTPKQTGAHRLILRATQGQGTCELRQDAKLLGSVRFGAAMRRYDGLRTGERLTTVPVPNGLVDFPALYFVNGRGEIIRRHTANIFVTTSLEKAFASVFVLAARWVPLGDAGPVRVVRNDATLSGHDPDRDGLGSELEQAVGTCSKSNEIRLGWECDRAADLRDTDGDGISDALELIGKMDDSSPEPFVLLPRWGADPRHKDIFIEVDYGKRTIAEPDSKMTPDVARQMAAAYAETNVSLTPIDALLHAQLLGNPDVLPGVRLHLDTGVAPVQPQDATIYGDWGGHNAVLPVCDANGCRERSAGEAYQTQMTASRRGIFHYASGDIGSGGQCGVGIACSWSHTDPYTAIHEFGHSLTLNHYGPNSDRPEANCKVNYPSVMSYQSLDPKPFGFSDGFGRPGFNNVALPEIGAVRPALLRHKALLERLRDAYGYHVDIAAGNVDWNRDGIFQAGTVAGYSNSFASTPFVQTGCEFSSSNRIPLGRATLRSPAIARFAGRVFIFSVSTGNRLEALVSNVNPFHCPPGGAPGCGDTQFRRFQIDQIWNQRIESVAAQTIVEGGRPKLVVLFTAASGKLFQITLRRFKNPTIFDDPLDFSGPTRVPTTQPISEEISTTGATDHFWLAFKDASGRIWLKKRANGTWTPDAVVQQGPIFRPFPSVPPGASPAIFEAPDGTLYGAFPKLTPEIGFETPGLQIWKLNPASGFWGSAGLLDMEGTATLGKPAMAWRVMPPDAALPGRLYLYWMPRQGPDTPGTLKENWLVRSAAGVVDMNFSIQHSNADFRAHGVAALSEPGVDDNVRLVVAFADTNPKTPAPDGALEIRPKADGIVDLLQVDRDDWEAMGHGLCRTVTAEQAEGQRIRCAS